MSSFSSSFACSTPNNDSMPKIIKNEIVRYKHKGYGNLYALLILTTFYYSFPKLIKLIWPFFLQNFSIEALYFTLALLSHTGSHIFINTIMYFIYKSKIPFFEKYKILDTPWPWESHPEQWQKLFQRTIKTLAISHFLVVPALLLADLSVVGVQVRMDLESFPGVWEIIGQLLFFAFNEDFFFYWSHRLLHHPKIYPYIHKIHHEYNITISLTAEYAHPLEFILGNVIPVNAGPKILGKRVHFVTYLIWIIVAQIETANQHCGYDFPWSPYALIPGNSTSNYHEFHHSHNVGNYSGNNNLWDTICGTNREYFKYLAKKERKQLAGMMQNEYNKLAERINGDPNTQFARRLEKNLEKVSEKTT